MVICFVAASGGLLVPAGALGDRIGHATMVVAGASLSVVAMAACALAPSFGFFLGARVLQGIGTATIMSSAPALATLASGPDKRERAIGTFQSASAVGLASGPVIGGLMVLLLGWRGVFWFRVPLAALLLFLAWRTLGPVGHRRPAEKADAGDGSDGGGGDGGGGGGRGVDATERPGGQSRLAAVTRPDVVVANLLTFVANGSMFATWLLIPALLVDEMGIAILLGGVVLAVSPATTALVAAVTARVVERIGATPAVVAGLLAMAAGLAVATRAEDRWPLDGGWSVLPVLVSLVLVGGGLGLFSVPNMAAVMAAAGSAHQGLAGAVNLMMRTLGIVVGAAWHSRLFDRLEPTSGFGPAFTRVFLVGAGVLVAAAALAATTQVVLVTRRPVPSSE